MKDNLNELLTHPVLAAMVGSLVGLRALPAASLPEKLSNVAASFALAVWGGSAAVEYLGVTSPKVAAGMVFIVGISGLVIFGSLLEGVRQSEPGRRVIEWALSWLPNRSNGGQ